MEAQRGPAGEEHPKKCHEVLQQTSRHCATIVTNMILLEGLLVFRDGETTIKIKFEILRRLCSGSREEGCPKTLFFFVGLHDTKILKVQFLLSQNFVLSPQAPMT